MEKSSGIGKEMYNLIERLYPICRSITGNGVRETLKILNEFISLEIKEVPTGKSVFDWTIPKEWNINDAFIKDSKGNKIVDFKKSNLHVLNYSVPIHKKFPLKELKDHLHTLPEFPNWIPYLTSYYKADWGFCLTHNQYESLKDDIYEVFIDSSLTDGHLSYGELFLKGKSDDEVLFTCYICHPSMCNDNLSGISLLTFLAKDMLNKELKYSYRFLFIPETIGAITWLNLNENKVSKIKHGLVVTCVGDSGKFTYKKTKNGNAVIDRIVKQVLDEAKEPYEIVDFFPAGSDERQFSSPAFDLPIGSLMRSMYAHYPQYHTSADDLNFVDPKFLENSFEKYAKIVSLLESDIRYLNLNPKCEPQLVKRQLYNTIGGQKDEWNNKMAIFWILNFSDGVNSLRDVSIISGIAFDELKKTAEILANKNLLKRLN